MCQLVLPTTHKVSKLIFTIQENACDWCPCSSKKQDECLFIFQVDIGNSRWSRGGACAQVGSSRNVHVHVVVKLAWCTACICVLFSRPTLPHLGPLSLSLSFSLSHLLAPPGRPTNLRAVATAIDSISLAWDPPVDDGGRTDLTYTIRYTDARGPSRTKESISETRYTLEELSSGVEYTITVISENGVSMNRDETQRSVTGTFTTGMIGECKSPLIFFEKVILLCATMELQRNAYTCVERFAVAQAT